MSTASKPMPSTTHLDLLRRGASDWNAWRAEHPDHKPSLAGLDLRDIDLTEADLSDADLSDADLSDADLFRADLTRANLKMATLDRADLSHARLEASELYKASMKGVFLTEADLSNAYCAGADLREADLRGARLHHANLSEANLVGARLDGADLTAADLRSADITDASMGQANMAGADVFDLSYGTFRSMEDHYYGIRGLTTCYGNAIFARDAADQDYLSTLRRRISRERSPMRRRTQQLALAGWRLIDYGRSLGRLAVCALTVATFFGVIYALDHSIGWGLMDYSGGSGSWLSPFYFSIVTYTTLGFGDITPRNWLGELIVVTEVVLGYVTLGMLLAILANRVARRA